MNVIARGLLASAAMFFALTPASAEEIFVSGLRPFERPAGAPRVVDEPHPRAWYVTALTGLEPPYPRSLFFLDAQGAWYTPFNLPGMPGYYDIRGWHKSK